MLTKERLFGQIG